MNKYKHLFFDLDRTLWDFDTNARITLEEVYSVFSLGEKNIPNPETFIETYTVINERMWADYRVGKIDKASLRSQRYYQTLIEFGIQDEGLAKAIGDHYIRECPLKTNLFPFTHACLQYLQERYEMHIITNGFEEVQAVKLRESDLRKYFSVVISSEGAGYKKPHPRIFEFALEQTGASKEESLIIGDDLEVDILGAQKSGWEQVYFNPEQKPHNSEPTYEIQSLEELISMF